MERAPATFFSGRRARREAEVTEAMAFVQKLSAASAPLCALCVQKKTTTKPLGQLRKAATGGSAAARRAGPHTATCPSAQRISAPTGR